MKSYSPHCKLSPVNYVILWTHIFKYVCDCLRFDNIIYSLSGTMFQVITEVFKKNSRLQYPVGHGVSGIVTVVGSNVTSVKVGQEVVGKQAQKLKA